ncbi:WD40-repeat-containing domain protein [Blyttiomyces helicus]|uniref:Dynein axonemal intermediate chain 4 n=1 Tax=Blyttiomyces helicus TaxID=388810 RepID=A0A4P9WL12_9FUNG|nr:WD40-repeat-containing domain protein [Blyttiomyces helicus]|eukprot:RKO92733.1 WD40-repeat-containing domain protein [Blyttiomyces helicus]
MKTPSSRNLPASKSSVYGVHGSQARVRGISHVLLDKNKVVVGGTAPGLPPVLDEDGNDVTPLPMMAQKGGHKGGHAISTMLTDARLQETVADVLNNLESMTAGSWNTSVFGRSGFQSNSSRASGTSTPEDKDDETSSVASADSGDGDDRGINTLSLQGVRSPKQKLMSSAGAGKVLTEHELNELVHLHLIESDTLLLFNLDSISVSSEATEEAAAVKAANTRYKELLAMRPSNENYVDRGMQTFNNALKNKDVQAPGPKVSHAECMTTEWGIYDAYHVSEPGEQTTLGSSDSKEADIDPLPGIDMTPLGSGGVHGGAPAESMGSTLLQGSTANGDVGTAGGGGTTVGAGSRSVFMEETGSESMYQSGGPGTLNQENLRNSLFIMERAIVTNTYEKKLIMFRDIVDAEEQTLNQRRLGEAATRMADMLEEEQAAADAAELQENEEKRPEDALPTLQSLWQYRCELTRGRIVMYMSWNKQNEDILAVAYGESKTPSLWPGLILCWSLKNPERIYRTKSCVTALDFSRTNPNLLACGYLDGRISVFDVRRKDEVPVLDNSDLAGKHRDPVWEVKWVERERVIGDEQSRGETLVSVSTDGRMMQWSIRKGFEYTDLMTLKRVTRQQEGKGEGGSAGGGSGAGSGAAAAIKSSAFIARQAGGLCFDFNPKDSNTYLQYLATYFGHTGPVQRVRWSPFLSGVFLSCSSDWTVRLWHQDNEDCAFKFQSGKDSVSDIAWSPVSSTMFGCVSSDGSMEIWDLQHSVLDPMIPNHAFRGHHKLTSIIFASHTPVVLTGDDDGAVTVHKMMNLKPMENLGPEAQAELLASVLTLKNQAGGGVGGGASVAVPASGSATAPAPVA